MSREKDQEYLCDGIAEEILTVLAKMKGLHVAARTSSFIYRSTALDTREIGRRLGVATLLEGSVRKAGDRLRVTTQLVDASTGYHLWSERYDREMSDVFAIQEEIARSVADALQVTLGPGDSRAPGRPPSRDVRAYDYYLRGRKYYFQYRRRSAEFALEMFERAIEIDPGYARAYAGIADCAAFLFLYVKRSEANRARAEAASRKALELDPDLAEAHASRGVALSASGQAEPARAAFETALRLDPGLFEAYYFYARHTFAQGDLEGAIRLYEQAMAVRPEDYQSPLLVAQSYDDLGRTAEAEAARRRGLRLAEEHLRFNPDDVRARYLAANALVVLGERERALDWARTALALDPDEAMLLYNVGCILSLAGEVDEAIGLLERAVTAGLTEKGWFEHDSNLDAVRQHPRFQALMQRL
jgi:TolB-like protein/Tfp pilus assembly protein PilF